MSTFDNIKFYSKKRGYTLRQTAEKAGLSQNALYRYNQGIEPKYETLKRVSKALNVPIYKLSDEYKSDENLNNEKVADIDDLSQIMRFQGQEIPEEDRETIIAMLKSLRRARKEENDK